LHKGKVTTNFPVEVGLAASSGKANSALAPERANESILRMKLRNANEADRGDGSKNGPNR
jgi:hypothetical protein